MCCAPLDVPSNDRNTADHPSIREQEPGPTPLEFNKFSIGDHAHKHTAAMSERDPVDSCSNLQRQQVRSSSAARPEVDDPLADVQTALSAVHPAERERGVIKLPRDQNEISSDRRGPRARLSADASGRNGDN